MTSFTMIRTARGTSHPYLRTIRVAETGRVQKKSNPPRISDAQNLQLEQLQQSVDAIAVEVERIAEAQRFSAKLLAERADPAALKRSTSTSEREGVRN